MQVCVIERGQGEEGPHCIVVSILVLAPGHPRSSLSLLSSLIFLLSAPLLLRSQARVVKRRRKSGVWAHTRNKRRALVIDPTRVNRVEEGRKDLLTAAGKDIHEMGSWD